MRTILTTIIYCLFTSLLIAQAPDNELAGVRISDRLKYSETDTVPTVIYLQDKTSETATQPAYFLNGEWIDGKVLNSLNPEQIKSIDVNKREITIEGQSYYGSINIYTKKSYKPKFISLNALKGKYTKASDLPTLFMIDGKIIEGDYDAYMVDEKHIMQVKVSEVINEKEGIELQVIHLLNRIEKNLEKANQIRLKGDSMQ